MSEKVIGSIDVDAAVEAASVTMIQVSFNEYGTMKERLADIENEKRRAIRQVRDHAQSLRRHLLAVKRDIELAIERAENGSSFGGSFGFGPIGHQSPFDVTVYSVKLEQAVQAALALGATTDEVSEAYTSGAKGER